LRLARSRGLGGLQRTAVAATERAVGCIEPLPRCIPAPPERARVYDASHRERARASTALLDGFRIEE